MVTIEISGVRAVLSGSEWHCDNKPIERALNAHTDDINDSPSDPNPEYTHAVAMAEKFNGKVLTPPKKFPSTPAGIVI